MQMRRWLSFVLAALGLLGVLTWNVSAEAGAGGVLKLDWVLSHATVIFDADVTNATPIPNSGKDEVDFEFRDPHVLRGALPSGASRVRFAIESLHEPGKIPPFVDPGAAREATSGR